MLYMYQLQKSSEKETNMSFESGDWRIVEVFRGVHSRKIVLADGCSGEEVREILWAAFGPYIGDRRPVGLQLDSHTIVSLGDLCRDTSLLPAKALLVLDGDRIEREEVPDMLVEEDIPEDRADGGDGFLVTLLFDDLMQNMYVFPNMEEEKLLEAILYVFPGARDLVRCVAHLFSCGSAPYFRFVYFAN